MINRQSAMLWPTVPPGGTDFTGTATECRRHSTNLQLAIVNRQSAGNRKGPSAIPDMWDTDFNNQQLAFANQQSAFGKMDTGEFLTRSTIWVSIVGYAVGSVFFALSSSPRRSGQLESTQWDSAARIVWSVACASLIAHLISAFHFYHGWSHAAAYVDTARQTEEVFGANWGGGLFINYALLLAWIVDIAWWWRSGLDSYRQRPWPLIALWHGLLIFIIFNATVVFGDGMVRGLGLAICLLLTLTWLRIVREGFSSPQRQRREL